MLLNRSRVLLSEFIGTMFLLIGVIGSGIMAERLSPSDSGLQLLQNAAATTGVLIAIISINEEDTPIECEIGFLVEVEFSIL